MVQNRQIPLEEFMQLRESVLEQWPTGAEVDINEAVLYQKKIPKDKVFAYKLDKAKTEGTTLAQPRAGVALVNEHIDLLNYLEEVGEADLLPTTIDSYTRLNRYQEAQKGIEESKEMGRSMLNGFPAVNHGVSLCRRVVEAVKTPIQVRHGTPDARLLAEITLAGGFTAYEGGPISYNIPYAKNVSLEETLINWQYVDRLVGYYEEEGISINREPFGPLTGTLVPASISHSVAIIEALLAAEQGVKSITLGYGQNGNLIQDVAAIRSLRELADEFLKDYNYEEVSLTTVFHQWMGGFPQDENKAYGVIGWGAATGAMAGATKVIVKTPHEAIGIPTKEANAGGILATKQICTMLKDQLFPETEELKLEIEMIKKETKSIISKILDLGKGDLAKGCIEGFAQGIIDVPFAPSRLNAGKIMPVRDNNGAVRFLDKGNLPFNEEIVDFHRERVAARGKQEHREPSFQMVIDDIYAIGKGMLVGRPR
jgi:methylaspartate mutase epsilon subunit